MKGSREKKANYHLNSNGEFVIENYNHSRPLANFFPGIAGKYGIPMWVFYVNRAQAIASFGTKDKDHSILEFFPADKAWQQVSLRGFRTFIKVPAGKKVRYYEPFADAYANREFDLTNRMFMDACGMAIEEENHTLGLKLRIEYFTVPNDSYAALARIVTVSNQDKTAKKIRLIDGLPQIIPFGTGNLFLKKLSRTIEAWMKVYNLERNVPFYKLDADPTDRPEVIRINEGNFYLGFHYEGGKPRILRPIVDPQAIFGRVTDFSLPVNFMQSDNFTHPKGEITKNKTPCGMLLLNFSLNPGGEKTFYSVIGYMRNRDMLNASVPKIIKPGYLDRKKKENRLIIEELQSNINTLSSSPAFNFYAKQTYLDNVIRGGFPLTFGMPGRTQKDETAASPLSIFYLYSRKHGDLERDYNKFQIQPSYLSQGNGNYRDMNQNRRCDVWFNPDIKEENLVTFFSLLQADGFNPLVVKSAYFKLRNTVNFNAVLKCLVRQDSFAKICACLNRPFTPGELILFIEENKIKLNVSYDDFLNILLPHCFKIQDAEHGEGFWSDHWTYSLDLLENFLSIYPEKFEEIIFKNKAFTFYDNIETVRPRRQKYVVVAGAVRQSRAVAPDNAKRQIIGARKLMPHYARTAYGKGEVYRTTLINKLLCLTANKLASLDPFGVGIEMEADKPNWFDALNGLPALLGSSLNETLELKRLIVFMSRAIEKAKPGKICVTKEVYVFLTGLNRLIREHINSPLKDKDFRYWNKSGFLKEEYREKVKLGFSGKEIALATGALTGILNNALEKLNPGINKAQYSKGNIYYGYFINQVKEYKIQKATQVVIPQKFIQKKLPLFLEPQVHALRLSENPQQAKAIHRQVKASELYDKKLKMYKVTACLKEMPEEIGRCRAFSPGWLEHESIWLHMEYKYLLEVLKQGLYEEFYADFKNVLIPFQPPQRYGRSILENSSFIVSSAFVDKNLHGNGYVARLSGSTAEFLNIWLIMNLGLNPFVQNSEGELNLRFKPALKAWLFTKKDNTYSFNLLGKVLVVYHNPKRKDTFGRQAVRPVKITFNDKDGNPIELFSDTIPRPFALQVRLRQINRIDILLS